MPNISILSRNTFIDLGGRLTSLALWIFGFDVAKISSWTKADASKGLASQKFRFLGKHTKAVGGCTGVVRTSIATGAG